MKCSRCHHENPSALKFCGECGARLTTVCASCGAANSPEQKFCGECGTNLSPDIANAKLAFPHSYTPKHLAEKILTSKSSLEGERKQVTVLFCDIANSTALSHKVGAEAMHAVLSRFFERALEQVHRYEGTANQFLGDGFMALFGAPIAHEDHARRAVLAALGIEQAVAGGPDGLILRMGLNTGPVVVGSIGDNLRMDYTAVGDTTNLAARLQQHAQPGDILISEATWRLTKNGVRAQAREPVSMKGIEQPVTAYQVTGTTQRRTPLETRENRGLSRFVGRERELTTLVEALDQAQAGHGQVLGVVGEAGVGKSRLLHEFRQVLAKRKATYLEGRCISYGKAVPYLPLQEIVRANCRITETDTPGEIGEKVRAALAEVDIDAGERTAFILHLLGVKEGTERLAQIGPETIKARIFDTVRQMSVNGSRKQLLVVVMEDLHWIDAVSEEYFSGMVDVLSGAPMLLLTTYRPGYKPPWIDRSFAAQIALRPLSSADSLSVVRSVQERAAHLPDESVRRVVEKAEGNPFFLEELTQALLERGSEGLPETIQGVLAARIDRLPEPARRLLQSASVVGREAPLELLKAVCDDQNGIEATLGILKRAELMHERQGPSEPVVVFKHVLTQEVAYDSLLTPRKQALHEIAGRAIERLYADRLQENYELLAHHYGRSSDTGKALDYFELATDKAMSASAVAEAKNYFDEAMKRLDSLAQEREVARRRLANITRHPVMFLLLLKFDEYLVLLRRHQKEVEEIDDAALLGMFYACLGHALWWFGNMDEAHETLTRGYDLSIEADGWAGVGYASFVLQWNYWYRGEFASSVAQFYKTLAAVDRFPNSRVQMFAHAAATWAHIWMGKWDQAVQEAERALRYGTAAEDDSFVSFSLFALGDAQVDRGSISEGINYLQQAVQRAPTPGDRYWAQVGLGCAQARAGDASAGRDLLRALVPISHASGFVWFDLYIQVHLGWADMREGQLESARTLLEGVLEPSERRGMRPLLIWAYRLLGEAMAASADSIQDYERAAECFERSMALCRQTGAENQLALAHAGLGRLLARQERFADGHGHLTTALEIFGRLGTLGEPEQVRADLVQLPGI